MDTAAWARNVGQLIRDIFGAEEEEVAEWIRSLGQLIRAGLGLAFAGITAWSIAALSSEASSFAFGRAEHIGFLVVGVLGLFLLADPPAEQSVFPEQKLRAGALPREGTGATWARRQASMNTGTWQAIASLGDRPGRS